MYVVDYLSKSLMAWGVKTVPQPVDVSSGSPIRGQDGEQAVMGVCSVLYDPQGLPEAPLGA